MPTSPAATRAMRDTARFHFGFTVPYVPHDSAASVIQAVAQAAGDLGIFRVEPARDAPVEACRRWPRSSARRPFVERPAARSIAACVRRAPGPSPAAVRACAAELRWTRRAGLRRVDRRSTPASNRWRWRRIRRRRAGRRCRRRHPGWTRSTRHAGLACAYRGARSEATRARLPASTGAYPTRGCAPERSAARHERRPCSPPSASKCCRRTPEALPPTHPTRCMSALQARPGPAPGRLGDRPLRSAARAARPAAARSSSCRRTRRRSAQPRARRGAAPGRRPSSSSIPTAPPRRCARRSARVTASIPARIVCGAGSDELLSLLANAYVGPGDEGIYSPSTASWSTRSPSWRRAARRWSPRNGT